MMGREFSFAIACDAQNGTWAQPCMLDLTIHEIETTSMPIRSSCKSDEGKISIDTALGRRAGWPWMVSRRSVVGCACRVRASGLRAMNFLCVEKMVVLGNVYP